MLTEERQFFEHNRHKFLDEYSGKYLLIKGEKLVGAYDDEKTAISEGARAFGLESFLVRRATKDEIMASVPALTLGILRAPS